MNGVFEFLFGLGGRTLAPEGHWRLEWAGLPSGDRALGAILALVAGAVGVWYLYRVEAASRGRFARLLLGAIRLSVVALIAVMLLEPMLVFTHVEREPSNLVVLLDHSRSMGLRDAWQTPDDAAAMASALGLKEVAELRKLTRLDQARRVLDGGLLATLEQEGDRTVQIHPFADRLSEPLSLRHRDGAGDASANASTAKLAATRSAASLEGLETAGQATAIGSATRQAISAYRGRPIAGILLISDGQSNAGESTVEAARLAAEEGIAFVALGAGTEEGPRNAAVAGIETSPVVFERDTNTVTIQVTSSGMVDVPALLVFEKRRTGAAWEEIGRQDLVLRRGGRLQTASFRYAEEQPGKIELRARLVDVGPELTEDDNTALSEVRVVKQKMRVLLIAGSTFPEIQFLRNTLLRDKTVELATWLMAADTTYDHPGSVPIRRLPTTQEEMNQNDCIILYDPDPDKWPENFSDLLTKFVVQAGGGLIYVAGEMQTLHSFERQQEPGMRWLSLLPVVREPGLFQTEVMMKLSAQTPWTLDTTPEGRRDPIFSFAGEPEENQRILESLPGMYWHFPVSRAKPAATVLARHGDPRMRSEYGPDVLLATHLAGPGRVVFVAFDSTYRWRYLDDKYYDGFWTRMVDRAGRNKQLGGSYPFRLSLDWPNPHPGSRVQLTARFNDPADAAPELAALQGEIEHGDDPPEPVTLSPSGTPGEFRAAITFSRSGSHMIRVWGSEGQQELGSSGVTLPVNVELPSLEFESPTLDRSRLEGMALAAGGVADRLANAAQAVRNFRIGRVDHVYEQRKESWDAPVLFGSIFLLLCAEWILRKRFRLI
jgi:hypothetical protein